VKFSGAFILATVSAVIGWYLHAYWVTPLDTVSLETKLSLPEPVDLRRYNTRIPSAVSEPAVKADRSDEKQLQSMLIERKYSVAMAFYNQLLANVSKQESERLRLSILAFVANLYQNKSIVDAVNLLDLYLESEYKDVDALRLKASMLAVKKEYKQQIDILYDAKSYAYQEREIEEIIQDIRRSVDQYKQDLLDRKNHAEWLALFQELVYLEPDYSPYFIELAKAQIENKLEDDARQSLELIIFDPIVGSQAQQLLSKFNVDRDSDESSTALLDDSRSVPLLRRGNHFVVEAILNNQIRLSLLIDTGASLTVIKPERLREAIKGGLDRYPVYLFNTANGKVKAPVLKVDTLAIGGFEIVSLDVAGLALVNTPGVDGLLGMNFLQHFRFFIDQESKTLRLSMSD
jgi:clan AA aspartic protease (TIGR02281 family)